VIGRTNLGSGTHALLPVSHRYRALFALARVPIILVRALLVNDRSTRAVRCKLAAPSRFSLEARETVSEGTTQGLELGGEMPPVTHSRGIERLDAPVSALAVRTERCVS